MSYTFSSDYAEKDIVDTLKEFFPDESSIMPTLTSRVRTRRLSATHICTVELRFGECAKESFSWPDMNSVDEDLFKELKEIQV